MGKAKIDEPKVTQARTNERVAARALLTGLESFLSSDKLDAKLVKCTVLSETTPRGLEEFVLHFTLTDGSRGLTIKEFTLTPVK